MPLTIDAVWTNAHIASLQGPALGMIKDGAIAVKGGRIAWVGAQQDLPAGLRGGREIDCGGALITPGLIDCHTHLVFAGNRAAEFERRLNGATYEEIARAGGGIMSTVSATRAASEEQLLDSARARLRTLMREGVTTVEIKSGYGLNAEGELKMLRVARQLGGTEPVEVRTTFLGAHALPPEYAGRADDYVRFICEVVLPAAAGAQLVDAVDAFCENIAFSLEQTRRVFDAAIGLGLPVKLHAEQLSNQHGAELAARHGALSADHLEHIDNAGVAAMAKSGTVAVLLPGAFYFLRETRVPPIELFRRHGVTMAVASDCNPGSSPIISLLVNMHMACTLFRLTPIEVLRGVTVNAAKALGLDDRGSLAEGMRADFCLWDATEPAELCYWMGGLRPKQVVYQGDIRHVA